MNKELKESIKKAIFDNIIKNELFGSKNIWDYHMQKEVLRSFPKDCFGDIENVINELLTVGIFELDERQHLRVTKQGQDLIFLDDFYTADRLENKILTHLRESNYYSNSVWPRLTYLSYCEKELNAYEKYIFPSTIDKMIDDCVFIFDEELNLRLTEIGENKIYRPTL